MGSLHKQNQQIISHEHPLYIRKRNLLRHNQYNGAYYYSKEIVRNIIPNVETDRNWVTIKIEGVACDHSIVFIHNNLHPEYYNYLRNYDDLVLVCGIGSTCQNMKQFGKAIYLPLSVDVKEVEQYRTNKTKDTAFVGRSSKKKLGNLPHGIDYLENIPREKLLERMAEYRNIYAVGRCAIEAKVLGCRVLPYDTRFPDPRRWRVIDNLEAADMLQRKLASI